MCRLTSISSFLRSAAAACGARFAFSASEAVRVADGWRGRIVMKRQVLLVTSIAACFVAASANFARGELIVFRMTGTFEVERQVGPLPAGIWEGAPFEAFLSYDLATPDSQADDVRRGFYLAPDEQENYLLIKAGPTEIRSTSGLTFWIGDGVEEARELWELPDDTFQMFDNPFTGNFVHPRSAGLAIRWNDPTGTVFSSDAFPTSLQPSNFTAPFIQVQAIEGDPRLYQFSLRANVESITVVPEPSALMLALTGIVMILLLSGVRRVSPIARIRR